MDVRSSATTRHKARRAAQPNAGARHPCLRAWMPELVPARVRQAAQGTDEAGAESACVRRRRFWVLFAPSKSAAPAAGVCKLCFGLAGRRLERESEGVLGGK